MQRTTSAPQDGGYDWLHFVARSGGDGTAWAEVYRGYEYLEEESIEALTALRENRFVQARGLLDRLGATLAALGEAPPAVRHVLERWYYGVVGYQHYLCGELDRAEEAMIAAERAVAAAVSRHRFLILLANHCHEFRLHRARIARNRQQWREMREHVEVTRQMMLNALPLCLLADGTPVFFTTLRGYYLSLPLTAQEFAWFADLFDDSARMRRFESFVHRLYVQPGFAIAYP